MDGPTPWRDAALDAEVILHEYTHAMFSRLTLKGSTSGGGHFNIYLDEGRADFYALALLSEPSDNLGGTYPFGAYSLWLLQPSGRDPLEGNYYFGGRPFPYSTNFTNNPLTFKDIGPTLAVTHDPTPVNPVYPDKGDASWALNFWGNVLWEARANMIVNSHLLFQFNSAGNGSDGQLAVWYMEGTQLASGVILNPSMPSDPKWRVVGTEDYNGDGNVDILFQFKNPGGAGDGDMAVWFMSGVNLISGELLSPLNPGSAWGAVTPR